MTTFRVWALGIRCGCSVGIVILLCGVVNAQIDAITQIKNLPAYNARSLGVKGDGVTDDTSALNKALAYVNSQGGGRLFLPRGTYAISGTVYIPNGVQLEGLGWSSPPEYGSFGTVIQANKNFSGGSTLPGNMILAIDGKSDTYGAGATDLTLDCNNVPGCGGLYRGHANEQTYFRRITVLNFSSYGLYVCGAGENGDAPNVCGGISNSGAQGDGPDEELQFLPNTAATLNTLPIVLRSVMSYRGLHDVTINTLSSSPNQPLYAGWISGVGAEVRNIHMEGPANGFLLGPQQGSVCPKNCNGLNLAAFSQIDLTRGGGPAIVLAGAYSLSLMNILPSVNYQLNAQNVTSAGPVAWMAVDAHGGVMSNDVNLGSTSPINTNVDQLTVEGAGTPQFVIQNKTGPNYPYFGFNMGTNGTLTLSGQGGTGDILIANPESVFGLSSGAAYSGMNLQSPFESSTGSMTGAICSNARWETASQTWNFSNNGGNNYACLYFPGQGGLALSAANGISEPGTSSQAQFLSATNFYVSSAGDLILGPDAPGMPDSGQPLQVNGGVQFSATASQPPCSTAIRGTFWFMRATSATTPDQVQVCAQGASGTLAWQRVF